MGTTTSLVGDSYAMLAKDDDFWTKKFQKRELKGEKLGKSLGYEIQLYATPGL